MAQTIVVFLAN